MAGHDIVAIGASAGGLDALLRLVSQLPRDLPAAIFVVVHISPAATSRLAGILNRAGLLAAIEAVDGQAIERGRIYVAPPNRHLLIKEGSVAVVSGPKENRLRPAIDPLFRTAARVYGARVVGVVLSGTGDDGVAGLAAIHGRGGITVVQDPADAAFGDLPRRALEVVPVDFTVLAAEAGSLLAELVREPVPASQPVTTALRKESQIAEADLATIEDELKVGQPSAFSCPECGGVLWEVENGEMLRFRCRVGHAYSAEALAEEQDDVFERALWSAFRTLEENASLARQMATRARRRGQQTIAERFTERADEARANADAIRQMILGPESDAHVSVTDT